MDDSLYSIQNTFESLGDASEFIWLAHGPQVNNFIMSYLGYAEGG